MNPRNILIVSTSAGTGHIRAAEALRAAMLRERPDWNVVHVDVLALAPRWLRAAYGGGFELVAARAPRVWRGIYRFADGQNADRARWGSAARRVLFRAFNELLRSTPWDNVVCTHFLPAQLAARGNAATPAFTLVVTDFALHRYWFQPGVSTFCVATHELAAQIHARLPHARVAVTGIPISEKFSQPFDGRKLRSQLGLDVDGRLAVIVGGGLGIGIESTARDCIGAAPCDVQFVAVCGRNEAAAAHLRSLALPRERLAVLGYTTDIERYLAAADVVVTKPGGLTCSEALALGKPLILTHPIPGHEEDNVRFLTQSGAAVSGCTPNDLQHAMQTLFGTGALLEQLGLAARSLGRPNAARDITSDLTIRLVRGAAA